jgi:hypothetical protein
VIILFTTRFNNKKFYVLTLCVYVRVVWISEQPAVTSLYNISFYSRYVCVYCAVGTESLNIIQVTYLLASRAMAHAVSRRPLTADATGWIPGQFMWDLCWTKWHWDRYFSEYVNFSLSVSFHQCLILTFIYILLLPEGQIGEGWEPSKNKPLSKKSTLVLTNKPVKSRGPLIFLIKILHTFLSLPMRAPKIACFLVWWPNIWCTVQIMKLLIM